MVMHVVYCMFLWLCFHCLLSTMIENGWKWAASRGKVFTNPVNGAEYAELCVDTNRWSTKEDHQSLTLKTRSIFEDMFGFTNLRHCMHEWFCEYSIWLVSDVLIYVSGPVWQHLGHGAPSRQCSWFWWGRWQRWNQPTCGCHSVSCSYMGMHDHAWNENMWMVYVSTLYLTCMSTHTRIHTHISGKARWNVFLFPLFRKPSRLSSNLGITCFCLERRSMVPKWRRRRFTITTCMHVLEK